MSTKQHAEFNSCLINDDSVWCDAVWLTLLHLLRSKMYLSFQLSLTLPLVFLPLVCPLILNYVYKGANSTTKSSFVMFLDDAVPQHTVLSMKVAFSC